MEWNLLFAQPSLDDGWQLHDPNGKMPNDE
jgi:hypothetical protein